MYECNKCHKELEKEAFAKTKKDRGFAYTCKECQRGYNKEHYNNNKDYYIAKAQRFTKALRNRVAAIKVEKGGCCICEEKEACCLDFHHKDKDKEMEIADLVNLGNWEKIQTEINKCVVLCANCHRKIHAGILKLPC